MKFTYKDSSQISEIEIVKTASSLTAYIKHLQEITNDTQYSEPESSINLPTDKDLYEKVMAVKKEKDTDHIKYFIDIGIGGSNLGAKAVYDAFYGYYDLLQPNRYPKGIFLDTVDEEVLVKLGTLIETIENKSEILVNAISKSGSTTETMANLEVVLAFLKRKFGDVYDRVVVTTDEGSKFWQQAQEKGIAVLPIPKQVGGRYSVFSPVGLFPFHAFWFNAEALRAGATSMREQCLRENVEENPAALSAAILFLSFKNGKYINDNFYFLPQLETMGKWYRQLMGESIGKEHDTSGNTVHTGLTPTVSIGSTDLHSVAQLYFGGPPNKITTFVWGENTKYEAQVATQTDFNLVPAIAGKPIHTIMRAIYEGVKTAYKNAKLPFMEVVLDKVDEQSLGEYMQFKMMEMMYLAKLLNVNAFDQPHVELYKIETKKLLK